MQHKNSEHVFIKFLTPLKPSVETNMTLHISFYIYIYICICVYSVQWMGLMIICCGMEVRRMGMLGVSEEEEGTDCEDGDRDTDW
jgi:hypothetical protein